MENDSRKRFIIIFIVLAVLVMAMALILIKVVLPVQNDTPAVSKMTVEENSVNKSEIGKDLVKKTASTDEEIITDEINNLKSGDKKIISRWFGESSSFSTKNVSDKVMATVVTKLYEPETGTTPVGETKKTDGVLVHICTLNYPAMQEASDKLREKYKSNNVAISDGDLVEIAKVDLAKMTADGMFDVHYNVRVYVENNEVVVTDELKQAITGNWYKGINTTLKDVECPLDKTKVVDKVIVE